MIEIRPLAELALVWQMQGKTTHRKASVQRCTYVPSMVLTMQKAARVRVKQEVY
jgi:hypothetical protein